MIDLHFCATPNCQKITIMLTEIGAEFRVLAYDIFEGHQLAPEFGRINPNHKLPAIVDHAPHGASGPIRIFESGAILQYLAEKSGQFLPKDTAARAETLSWLTWQVAGLGPMSGQASHFMRYAGEGNDYAIARYSKEVARLLAVLEKRLSQSPYVGGEDYSIADMAIWPGQYAAMKMGMRSDQMPAINDWVARIAERPAVQAVLARTDLAAPDKYVGRHQKLSDAEWSNMFGDANHGAVLR
jgi:GST-like protein